MFEDVVHAVQAQNMATSIKITEVQNILFNFTVLWLYIFIFNIIYYLFIYFGYGHMI